MVNVLCLRWGDIDLASGVARIERTKYNDPLIVPLNSLPSAGDAEGPKASWDRRLW